MNKKEYAKEFERTLLLAKARAYSKVSLERPLNEFEFREFKDTMDKLKE
ncbi:MAG: hypothetical protein KKB31_04930 [Nanoarchaeota archaeon]|nr:hypothetical protein [Nanoarchaeota archaeon]